MAKFIEGLFDGATIVAGSFNFPKAADEKNAENLLIRDARPVPEASAPLLGRS